jgi:hypothetical protein
MFRDPRTWLACALLVLAGCADRTQEYIEVLREQRRALDELAEVLSRIEDEKGMAAAKADLAARFTRYDQIARRARDLPPPSDEMRRKLEDDGAALRQALVRVQEQVRRVQALPGGDAFFKQFDTPTSLLSGLAPS